MGLDTPAHFRCALWNANDVISRARNCLISGFSELSESAMIDGTLALVSLVYA